MKIGNRVFEVGTHVMAIVNLTPDSFWEKSRATRDSALFAVERAVKEGAEVIDIGAQSTRPGYKEVDADCEISRLEGVIGDIKKNFDIPVSVDTYFSKTAEAALNLGADMINDVWGLTRCADMAQTVAKHGAAVCIMHNSETPLLGDIWGSICDFLRGSVNIALGAGIESDKILLDGGIGFAKNREQNFELLNGYERLLPLGYPLLLGTSRKSMFGGKAEDRLAATLESTRLAVKKGVLFVRVHDVKENAEVIKREYERN